MQTYIQFPSAFQQFLNKYLYKHPNLYKTLILEKRSYAKYPSRVLQQMGSLAKNLDPFNLCPFSLYFWFLIEPYNAIGVALFSLTDVRVFWRQQIEPNETIYLMFNIFRVRSPFPLTLLILFSGAGLVILEGVIMLLNNSELENPEDSQNLQSQFINNLLPKMSIYHPVLDGYTSIGFLTIDFRHIEISLKQLLEPNETLFSLVRFIDIYSPFTLQLAVIILSVGLFVTGHIYNLLTATQEEILKGLNHLPK